MKNKSNKLNHKQIVEMVCDRTNGNKEVVQQSINCYIDVIMEQMCLGFDVGVKHLGTLKVVPAKKTVAFDFKTKQNTVRPNRYLPKMVFGRNFSNRIKSNK